MFCLVDLETRSTLTYRDATPILYGSEALALNHALIAQETTGHPHALMCAADAKKMAPRKTPAPWFN